MRTIRQRKDDLLNLIREKKQAPVTVTESVGEQPVNPSLFEEYKKVLVNNGIRNEELITTQLNRMIRANLPREAVYSNLKFMLLFRSRLIEEGIPLADAEHILTAVEFNMAEINEDDDYIGDVALEYSELCKVYYDYCIKNNLNVRDNRHSFNLVNLQLPA